MLWSEAYETIYSGVQNIRVRKLYLFLFFCLPDLCLFDFALPFYLFGGCGQPGPSSNLSSQFTMHKPINTLRPRQNGRHFTDDTFKPIFLNESGWISIKISLNFVPKVPINNIPALVQIMAWHRPGDKPLSEPVMVNLLTHICVTRPQWVKCGTIFWQLWIHCYLD